MEILERGPALIELSHHLHEAAAGRGRLVFVGGEAGIGKTVLMRRFCEMVSRSGRVLVGACDPLSTPRPLAPLLDIAEQLGGARWPELLESAGRRDRLFRAFLAELSAGPQPALVVVEDAHWADEATLDLIRFLGRRCAESRALLLVTYREDEVGDRHPLRVVLGDLATAASVGRLTLVPLSPEAVGTLAAGSGLDAAALHRQTGGNPFFVTEILAARGSGIPATVRDAVLARAARLAAPARAALEAAAVIGFRIEPWLLEKVTEPAVFEAADACVAAGMLCVQGEGLAFRHELAREAVLAAVSPPRRLAQHRAVLAALREPPGGEHDPARLAHHAEAAGDREAVLEFAPEAARRAAALSAHREAAAQYARALRFAEDQPAPFRAALLEAMAYEYYLTDQIPKAIEARRTALELWRAGGDARQEGDNLRWLSRLSWFIGDAAGAERAGRRAIEVLERLEPGRELAMAYSNWAQLRMLADDREEAVRWGEQAIALAEAQQDIATLAHALNNVGTALLHDGKEAGRTQLERSLQLSREAGLEEHVARAYTNLGSGSASQYRLAEADRYLAEGIAYSAEHDLDSWRLYMSSWQAITWMYRGSWAEARGVADSVRLHPNVSPISAIQALVVLGRIAARSGDPEAATAALDPALELATRTGELQRLGPVRTARAEAAWLAGDPDRVRSEVEAGLALALEHRHAWFGGELLFWLARTGEAVRTPPWIARPFALQISGDWAEAAAEWQRLGCPYEAARAWAETGEAARLRGALEEFERLGARPLSQLTARRLREAGVRGVPRGPRPSTRANPASLTRREVEIVRLLAEGLQNAQIARRLFLSPKTVGHHVSAVLAKLGVPTRAAAVHEAQRLGLLAQDREAGAPN